MSDKHSPLDDLISMCEAARRAGWGRVRFKAFAIANRLLILDGRGARGDRFVVNWPEVERAILNRPRYVPPTPEKRKSYRRPPPIVRASSQPNPDVYC